MIFLRKVCRGLWLLAAVVTVLGSGAALQGCHAKDPTMDAAPTPTNPHPEPMVDKHLPGTNGPGANTPGK